MWLFPWTLCVCCQIIVGFRSHSLWLWHLICWQLEPHYLVTCRCYAWMHTILWILCQIHDKLMLRNRLNPNANWVSKRNCLGHILKCIYNLYQDLVSNCYQSEMFAVIISDPYRSSEKCFTSTSNLEKYLTSIGYNRRFLHQNLTTMISVFMLYM